MKLDRDSMLAVIKANGSIFLSVGGVHKCFTSDNISEFPTVADLALGNKEAEQAAKKELDEQLKAILAEQAKLADVEKAKAEEVKETAKAKKAEKDAEVK